MLVVGRDGRVEVRRRKGGEGEGDKVGKRWGRTKRNGSHGRDLRHLDKSLVGDDGYLEGKTDTDAGEGLVSDPLRGWGADVESVDEAGADGGDDGAAEEEWDVHAEHGYKTA